MLSTDMSKAFDCLFPPLMLAKLRAYSFDDVSLKLMASYFEDRQARVKLGNTTSGWKKVQRGCPQSSSFGPLMWNLYQNDLTYVLKSNISMYADDHQFFVANKYVQLIQTRLQESAAAATSFFFFFFRLRLFPPPTFIACESCCSGLVRSGLVLPTSIDFIEFVHILHLN